MTYKGEWLAVARQEIKRLRKLLKLAPVLALAVLPLWAQSTAYDNVGLNVNVGNPSYATFIFGHRPDGQPGTTELVIQCSFDRAELFTNVGVYGQQAQSQFFAATCTESESEQDGLRVLTFTLDSAPLAEALVMYGYNGAKTNLNLTINGATWTVTNPSRWQKWTGSSQIVVQ